MKINPLESLSDNIVIDHQKCVYCGVCVETCILDNLRMKLAPCREACPLGVNCQGYVRLIERGDEKQAMVELEKTLPFHGILGRICSQPCENNCHRKKTENEAVSIRALKRYLSDTDPREELPLPEMSKDSGFSVAVAGSGPAGLMAAYELAKKGHRVTVLDADTEPGGMLRWAIPSFRLPVNILDREISRLRRMGITFRQSVKLGTNISLENLKNNFHALILALGCQAPQTLDIEGVQTDGVYYALDFLRQVRSGANMKVGKKVVVIGGGDVALDAAQTALRLGAEDVQVACLESEQEMPAHNYLLHGAIQEGVQVQYARGPVRIKTDAGKIQAVEFKRCIQVFDQTGNFAPLFDDQHTFMEEADSVVISIGQKQDYTGLQSLYSAKTLDWEPLTRQSNEEKIFLAGDLITGPSSVVEAMASGLEAAISADRYVLGEDLAYGRLYPGPIVTNFDIETKRGNEANRVELPRKVFRGKEDWDELEQVLSTEAARREAGRCYACGEPFGKYRTCWFCLPCEVECPHNALWVEVPYLLR